MNFTWLQFWGDLRQGLHPSWLADLPEASVLPHGEWQHRQRASAQQVRCALQIAEHWDASFSPAKASWMALDGPGFSRWCQACGLLALGDHLKRLVSVRAVERLQISLDRRTLARIIEFTRDQTREASGPLPLDIPTAARLGAHALQRLCAPLFPQVWSRLRLRFERGEWQQATPTLPFAPDFDTLSRFDTFLFDPARPLPQAQPLSEDDSWTPLRTLSA